MCYVVCAVCCVLCDVCCVLSEREMNDSARGCVTKWIYCLVICLDELRKLTKIIGQDVVLSLDRMFNPGLAWHETWGLNVVKSVGMWQDWLLCWNVTGLVVMLECYSTGCYVGMWQGWLLCWNVTGLVVMLECDRTGCYVGTWQDWLLCWNVTGLVVMLECDRTGCYVGMWQDWLLKGPFGLW